MISNYRRRVVARSKEGANSAIPPSEEIDSEFAAYRSRLFFAQLRGFSFFLFSARDRRLAIARVREATTEVVCTTAGANRAISIGAYRSFRIIPVRAPAAPLYISLPNVPLIHSLSPSFSSRRVVKSLRRGGVFSADPSPVIDAHSIRLRTYAPDLSDAVFVR